MIPPDNLTARLRWVRDSFREGGSLLTVLLVLATITAAVLLVYWLSRRQEKAANRDRSGDPYRLFRTLMVKLDLSRESQDMLLRMARDLRLVHPTIVLLSDRIFDEQVSLWGKGKSGPSGTKGGRVDGGLTARARAALFPMTKSAR